jgi:hypothetical protein
MTKEKSANVRNKPLEAFFKVGVSPDYILMRRDFPLESIPPGDFTELLERMFRQNEKALSNDKQ